MKNEPEPASKIRRGAQPQHSEPEESHAKLNDRTSALVDCFARALKDKLAAAQVKYGFSDGWSSPDWEKECQCKLAEHAKKGDPRDVAAFCAFMWHHGWRTCSDVSATSEWEVRPAGSHFPELSYIADGEKLFGTLNKYQANAIADAHNAEISAERERHKPLVEALEKAADTFADLKTAMRIYGKLGSAKACEIAEEATRAALPQAKEQP